MCMAVVSTCLLSTKFIHHDGHGIVLKGRDISGIALDDFRDRKRRGEYYCQELRFRRFRLDVSMPVALEM